MRQVTFARAQPPGYGVGDKRLVPDAVAEALAEAGEISASEIWPTPTAPVHPARPRRALHKLQRPVGVADGRLAL